MNIPKKKSIILLHGLFEAEVFNVLNKHKGKEIFVLEGRPSLESAQVTCQELFKRKIIPTVITDNMAGFLFYKNLVKEVWISYESFGKDGALCPIGSLILGILGRNHKVPVLGHPGQGDSLLLGKPKGVLYFNGERVACRGAKGYAPLVEWVPKKYINQM